MESWKDRIRRREAAMSGGMPESASFHSRGYHRYFEGYTEHTVTGPDGKKKVERIYTGVYHRQKLEGAERRRVKRTYVLLFALQAILFLFGATRPVPANSFWAAGIFQGAAVLSSLVLVYYLAGYLGAPENMTMYQYMGALAMKKAALFTGICLLLCGGSALLYTLVRGRENLLQGLAASLSVLGSSALLLLLYRMENGIVYDSFLSPAAQPEDGSQIEA